MLLDPTCDTVGEQGKADVKSGNRELMNCGTAVTDLRPMDGGRWLAEHYLIAAETSGTLHPLILPHL